MTEIYNKYNKLEATFAKIDNYYDAFLRARELKIKAHKIIEKSFQRFFTYYCTSCKKRSYFEKTDPEDCCKNCNDSSHLFFVGFKQTDKLIEKVIYVH